MGGALQSLPQRGHRVKLSRDFFMGVEIKIILDFANGKSNSFLGLFRSVTTLANRKRKTEGNVIGRCVQSWVMRKQRKESLFPVHFN
jgi:hypothetical protein